MQKLLPVVIAGLIAASWPAAAQTTLERVKQAKVLVAGNSGSYPPFEMMEGNKLTGFDVDLAEELGRRIGVAIKWEVIDFKGIIAALTSKRVDTLISAITWTPERAERVAFSMPYGDLLAEINRHLEAMKKEGILARLDQKWFGALTK